MKRVVQIAGQGRLTSKVFFLDLPLTNTGGADASAKGGRS